MATRAVLSNWQGLVLLLPAILATPLYAAVLADANPLHCLHWLLWRLCSQMLAPLHCLHVLLWRLCSQMLDLPHCVHLLLWRWCSQMLAPPALRALREVQIG